jgi:hypothetical protein
LANRTELLLAEAQAVGLLPSGADGDPRALLSQAVRSPQPTRAPSNSTSSTVIVDVTQRRDQLQESLREARSNRRTLLAHRQLAETYDEESQEQHRRLTSLELLPGIEGDEASCPLCGSHDGDAVVKTADLRKELEKASARAVRSAATPPQLESAITEMDELISSIRSQLADLDRELALALKRSRIPTEAKEEREQRAFVRGRLASFLDEHPLLDDDETALIQESIQSFELQIEELESDLSSETTRSRTENALSYVNEDMTEMARTLGLSYASDGVTLDPFNLTVVGRDPRGPVRLDRRDIGSGKSWVGYHLVTLLALHRFFIEQKRPVPRMLLLDQPTQAFYPSEKRKQADRNFGDIPDDDQEQVHRIFELIRTRTSDLDGSLQVIILDHAELPEPWFDDAVGENNWRYGQALVPSDWF